MRANNLCWRGVTLRAQSGAGNRDHCNKCAVTLSFRHVKRDDFDYAIQNTQVMVAPQGRIETFGSTSFNFYVISELMDRVDQVRVRNGKIHAERPQILAPDHFRQLMLEGFGEKAHRYIELLQEHLRTIAVLRYGFQFRKTDVTEET